MSDNPGSGSFDAKRYQRPQQTWVCGHHAEGTPCPIGPSGKGECQVHQICVPWHDGATWHCTRARAWGGRCKDGPVPDPQAPDQRAVCPHSPIPCQPVRSLRSKRQRLGAIVAAVAFGFCLVVLGGSSGPTHDDVLNTAAIISPGPLTAHHATIDQGCAGCHSAASESPLKLVNWAFGGGGGIEESHKCLECHQELGEDALFAHSTNPTLMARETARLSAGETLPYGAWQSLVGLLPKHHATEAGELACATCHHEHQGANFDLTSLSNSQCQSCHASTFASFSEGHPEFAPRERAALYFDHVTHLRSHFPAGEQGDGNASRTLTCSDCHIQDATGTSMILGRFENMCAQCHSGQIADDRMPRELRMPGNAFLTLNLAEIQNHPPDKLEGGNNWPTSRIDPQTFGNSYQELPPFMETLLLADDEARAALATLRAARRTDPGSEAYDLSGDRAAYAAAIKRLVKELVAQREEAVTRRLMIATGERPGGRRLFAVIAASLADTGFFTALREAQSQWFPDLPPEPKTDDADAETAVNDQRASQPLTGPWMMSEDGLTLNYRSRGHADPLVRALLDFSAVMATQYPDSPSLDEAGIFDRLFRRLAAPEATGHCMKCHTFDAMSDGTARINWYSSQGLSTKREFTKFSHGPHITLLSSEEEARALNSSSDNRCETCHAVQDSPSASRKTEFLLSDWMPNPDHGDHSTIGVNSVDRASCIKCHTPNLAGDNCLQCHNYHIDADSFTGLEESAGRVAGVAQREP